MFNEREIREIIYMVNHVKPDTCGHQTSQFESLSASNRTPDQDVLKRLQLHNSHTRAMSVSCNTIAKTTSLMYSKWSSLVLTSCVFEMPRVGRQVVE
jgi:hypothetical protein